MPEPEPSLSYTWPSQLVADCALIEMLTIEFSTLLTTFAMLSSDATRLADVAWADVVLLLVLLLKLKPPVIAFVIAFDVLSPKPKQKPNEPPQSKTPARPKAIPFL